jgi:hypothetical protein
MEPHRPHHLHDGDAAYQVVHLCDPASHYTHQNLSLHPLRRHCHLLYQLTVRRHRVLYYLSTRGGGVGDTYRQM